jgi:hypothetical protein
MAWTGKTKEELREYNRLYYHNKVNKSKKIDTVNKRKLTIKNWLNDIKNTLKCSRCDENHPACLDFHHVDTSTKEFNLGDCVRKGYSKERIEAEIAKCIILCANCHRKLHFEDNMPS